MDLELCGIQSAKGSGPSQDMSLHLRSMSMNVYAKVQMSVSRVKIIFILDLSIA